ncbi:MAG: thioredoxin domain-containing protein [Aggregatilineales bacterium]
MKNQNQQQLTIIAAMVVVAVVAVGIFIFLSRSSAASGSDIDYSSLVQTRTEDGAFIVGNPDAPITIVEFADFMCPHCQAYHSTVSRIMEELVLTGQARFEYRMLPTQDISPFVGQVAECAADQYEGGFFPIHDELFRIGNSSRITNEIGRRIAEEFDLDYAELLSCTQEAEQVTIDQRLANRLGVQGTPAIRVRYGDSEATAISETYARGSVPYEVIEAAVNNAQ